MTIKMNTKSITNLILLWLPLTLYSFTSYADTIKQPLINVNRTFWNRTGVPGDIPSSEFVLFIKKGISHKYENLINKNKEQIREYNLKHANFKIKNKSIKNRYDLSVFPLIKGSKEYGRYKDKGIYIFNKSDVCIGHLFLTKGNLIDYVINQPEFVTVKGMTLNANYLGNKLVIPRNEIKFYEKDHGDFIERYAMNDKYLYMQAFYPKELENFMQKRIIDVLNFNYTSAKNAPINTTDEEFEATSQRMEDQDELDNDE